MSIAIHPIAGPRPEGPVLLICADARLAHRYQTELSNAGGPHRTPLATNVEQAQAMLRDWTPRVIAFDESCFAANLSEIATPESVERTIASLTEHAPVVAAVPERFRAVLAFLIEAGAVDHVTRTGNFVAVTAGMVVRRALLSEDVLSEPPVERERTRDFGEMLRHEVNNPLTGILGNAEMLLKQRSDLAPPVIARLETIAELAVRLRETIRRLSDCWEEQHDSARMV
jgi:signal transduction histidine kinase